jgi:glutathione S-transferase
MPMNVRKHVPTPALGADTAKDIARIRALWREARERHAGQGPFLFGAFSIADAMYVPVALRLISYSVDIAALERAYVDTLLALPAMREWLAEAATEALAPEHEKTVP